MADANDKITLFTTEPCGFCRQAKALLAARGLDYQEINLAKDPDGRADLVQRTGQLTFPQIVVGDRSIGGFRELLAADRDGTLQDLLGAWGLHQRREDLTRCPLSRLDGAVQVALEVDRRVLAGEVAAAHLLALRTRELRVLADLPVRVRALRVRVALPPVDGRLPVPLPGDARQHRLDLAEELLRAARRGAGAEARAHVAAGVVDQDPARAGLAARHLPGVLVAAVGVGL